MSLAGWFRDHDAAPETIRDMFRTFNAGAAPFRKESEAHEQR
jgi:hypothetical protein